MLSSHLDMEDFLDQPGARILRELLTDPAVSEIMINGPEEVFVERLGRMEKSDVRFESSDQLRFLIETMMRPTGRTVDANTPFADCRLPDGSRVNIVLPPIAVGGATVTIRRFSKDLHDLSQLVQLGTLTERMGSFLETAIRGRLNILFSGGTGTGKTTTLGILSESIAPEERIVIIEDTSELELRQKHVVQLECRPPNVEGAGEVTLEQLLRNSLRMRPTRIILGEIRGPEAVELLQAVRSGHDGSLAVVHASTPRDAISRLELMTLSRGYQLPLWGVQSQIAGGIDLILQHQLADDGVRRITHVTEVGQVEDGQVGLRNLFEYRADSDDWICTGEEPAFLDKLRRHGVSIPEGVLAAGTA